MRDHPVWTGEKLSEKQSRACASRADCVTCAFCLVRTPRLSGHALSREMNE